MSIQRTNSGGNTTDQREPRRRRAPREPLFKPELRGLSRLVLLPHVVRQQDEFTEADRRDKVYTLTLHYLRFSAERERFYRLRFEAAPENGKGEIAATFLEDAPVSEWPLASWLWKAIGEWKFRGGPIARRNLHAITSAVARTLPGRPGIMALDLAERNRLRAKPVDPESERVGARLYPWVKQNCQRLKAHWRQPRGATRFPEERRFELFLARIEHKLPSTPPAIVDFYNFLNELVFSSSWDDPIVEPEVTDTSGFLKRVCCPGAGKRPWRADTAARFIVRWTLGIPYRRIPKSAPIAHAR